jgi:ribulose-5-phosphate 4-epimerase/fuculose-1-phosphate aldolase
MEATQPMHDSAINAELQKLAIACRILEMEGHGDMVLGHLSWRDPQGRGMWMKRNEIALGEVIGPDDFVLLDFNGSKLHGSGRSHSEWPIHSEIMIARPDVQIVIHTHPIYASIMSGSKAVMHPYTVDADKFLEVPRFDGSAALINDKETAQGLAKALGSHDVVFLANHGVTFCGPTVEYATCIGIFLERACRIEILATRAGVECLPLSDEMRAFRHRQVVSDAHIRQCWAYFMRKLEWTTGPGPLFR